jgi:hypothetical protein
VYVSEPVYSKKGEEVDLSALPVSVLKNMPGVTMCNGFVIEVDKVLDTNRSKTEFM